ncbi:MAG: hypothetical protein CL693_16835 [Cellvibrionaceae bacterium]|nr:hypothetical protein [Cellvibrionaceae bacterium]
MHLRNNKQHWTKAGLKCLALGFIQLLIVTTAFAGVNFNNGNFYMSYTDLVAPEDRKGWPIEVDRTYNSLASFEGIYGPGWGSTVETYLEVESTELIKVYESGCGSVTVYQKEGVGENEERIYRRVKGYASKFLIADTDGYHRSVPEGVQHFNHQGMFTHLNDEHGRSLHLERDSSDRIRALVDNLGRRVEFLYSGHYVSQIQLGDAQAHFRYEDRNLIESRDVAGNHYRYQYDRDNKMSHVFYEDGSHLEVRYGTTPGQAYYVKNPDGQWESYRTSVIRPLKEGEVEHYRVESKRGRGEKTLSERSEEIVRKRDKNNQTYMASMKRFDGDELLLEIENNDCGIIKRRPQYGMTRYWQYDKHCRTISYREGEREMRFSYQQDSERISRIDEYRNDDWIRDIGYGYNMDGELLTVTTSEQNWQYRLSWNRQGDVLSFSNEKDTYFMDYLEKGELESIEFGGRVIMIDGPHDDTSETRSPAQIAADDSVLISFIKSWQSMQKLIAYANDKRF